MCCSTAASSSSGLDDYPHRYVGTVGVGVNRPCGWFAIAGRRFRLLSKAASSPSARRQSHLPIDAESLAADVSCFSALSPGYLTIRPIGGMSYAPIDVVGIGGAHHQAVTAARQ